jgi:hypothetical protein
VDAILLILVDRYVTEHSPVGAAHDNIFRITLSWGGDSVMMMMMMMTMMMMIISPFGQLGLWAPSSGRETYSHQSQMLSHTPVIEESGHPRYGQEAPVVCQQIPQGV